MILIIPISKTNLSTAVGAFSSTDVVSCYSSNTICTYEGRIVDTNNVLNSLALNMPLGYVGNITIAIAVSDEEFMVTDKVDLVVSLQKLDQY